MVKRGAIVLLAGLLWGCPDDVGGSVNGVVTGLQAPADLTAVANGGSEVLLSWKDRATVETGYRLEMSFGPFDTPIIGGVEYLPADATSFVFPAFPNSTYYFRVFAVTSVMESDPSEVIAVSTPDVPERPLVTGASPVSTTQIAVRWGDVSNETGYRVERSANEGGPWVVGFAAPANASQGSVPGLLADSEYLVRVIATNAHGDSTPSRPVRASTLSALVALTFASGPDAGKYTSYQMGPDGVEHLAHYDVASTNVLYTTSAPSAPTYATTTVDAGPTLMENVGGDGTSVAVDGAGKIYIVAHDQSSDRLRYITNASGSWVATTLEYILGSIAAGAKPRIVRDPSSGNIHIYYHSLFGTGGTGTIVYQATKVGASWHFSNLLPMLVDTATTYSLTIDGLGVRHLAVVSAGAELWHVRESGIPDPANPPVTERIPLPPSFAPHTTAVAATADGVHVLFHDVSSGSLHHSSSGSGGWVTETVDQSPGQDVGGFCAAAIHAATGRLHVAYYDATNGDLKYARKDPGGAWVRKVLDAGGDVGAHVSIVLDAAGAVRIAYRDETNQRLKIAKGTP